MPKTISSFFFISIAFFFLMCALISDSASADEGASFYCPLGLDGRLMAEVELQLSEDGSALHYKLEVNNVEDILMAHLHLGLEGVMGTPIVWLYPSAPPPKLIPGMFTGTLAQGTIAAGDLMGPMRGRPLSLLVAEIRSGNVYINIHTRTHIRGEVCGTVRLKKDE